MIDKTFLSAEEAISDIHAGATVLISGFGNPGMPFELVNALIKKKVTDLTLVTNNTGTGYEGIAGLLKNKLVKKVICCYPRREGSIVFEELYRKGAIEVELVPHGTFCERIRAGAAGISGFYTHTGVGTLLAKGKEVRELDGKPCILELPIKGDFSFIKARSADRWGNLVYDASARNMGPVMAGAAKVTVAQVDSIVPLGVLDPEHIVTPGIFVNRVVAV